MAACKRDLSPLEIEFHKGRRRLLVGSVRKNLRVAKWRILLLAERQEWLCAYCGLSIRFSEYHVEHVIPVAVGGTNDLPNLVLSCPECNHIAGAKAFSTFSAKRDYILGRRARKRLGLGA